MKLSDIKGQRSLDIIADAMELVEAMADDERFKALADAVKGLDGDDDGAWRVFCKHFPPILRDELYQERIVSILAAIADVPQEEYAESGEIVADLFGLVLGDSDALGFLAGAVAKTD